MRATTYEVAGPPAIQRDGYTISSPLHSPAKAASLRCSSSGVGAARWFWAMGLTPVYGLNDVQRGFVDIVRRPHVEARSPPHLLAGFDVGPLHPHHQPYFQAGFLHRGHQALGDDIAFHDAAEN